MSQSGPQLNETAFIAALDGLIKDNQADLQHSANNIARAEFLRVLLIQTKAKVPSDLVKTRALLFSTLRKHGFSDEYQPIINAIEKAKLDKNFLALTTKSKRAAFIEAMLDVCGLEFEKEQIALILEFEGLGDKVTIDPRQAIFTMLVLSLISFSLYSIFRDLKSNPGNYARNFTMGMTTKALNQSISSDRQFLKKLFNYLSWAMQFAVFTRMLPSLGSAFEYFPENLDPKLYGDKAVHSLEDTFGSNIFYVLAPLVLLMSIYGPQVILSLMHKLANNPLMESAHDFCTLMRGGEDAGELLEQKPELNESFAVRGLNWSYKSEPQNKSSASAVPSVSQEEEKRVALSPD